MGRPHALHVDAALEARHFPPVTAIGAAARDLLLHDAEVLSEPCLKPRTVERGESADSARRQTGVDQRREPRDIRWVEDDGHKCGVRAVLPDLLAQTFRDLAVALEQILARHAFPPG